MIKLSKSYDVIVAGAGLSGLHISKLLSEEGLDVLILEKKEEIGRDVFCSGIVGRDCIDRFPFLKNFVLKEIQELRLVSPSGTTLHYRHPSPFAYVVEREEVERFLWREAVSKGVTFKLGRKVINALIKEKFVEVITENYGEIESYSGNVLVIATGYKISLQKKIGLGYPENFIIAGQKRIKTEWNEPLTIVVGNKISRGGFGWIIPLKGLSMVGVLTEANARKGVEEILRNFFPEEEKEGIRVKPIVQGLSSKTYGERTIVVGESAGQVKTTTGGGIYFGLLCTEINKESILEAFKKRDFREKIFSNYEKKWKKIIGDEIKKGLFLRKLCGKLSDAHMDRIVELAIKNGYISYIAEKAKFDEHVNVLLKLLKHKEVRKIFMEIIN